MSRRRTTQIDSGATQLYGGPFVVSASGARSIVYWSTDNAGNSGPRHQGYVNIDGAEGLEPYLVTKFVTQASI